MRACEHLLVSVISSQLSREDSPSAAIHLSTFFFYDICHFLRGKQKLKGNNNFQKGEKSQAMAKAVQFVGHDRNRSAIFIFMPKRLELPGTSESWLV